MLIRYPFLIRIIS